MKPIDQQNLNPISPWRKRERVLAYLLFAPTVIYLFVLSIYPIFNSLWISFQNYVIYSPADISFAGIENYRYLFGNTEFRHSLVLTIVFVIVAVSLEFGIGLFLAVLLDRKMAGMGILRTLLLVPILASPVGMGLTFRYILNGSYGLLNYCLSILGLPTVDWIVDVNWVVPVIILADIWQWTPFVTLILLAAIQSVSEEVTEAASLDGLSEWQKMRLIVLPMIKPIILVILLIRSIDAVRTFDLTYVLTHGGPGTSTELLSILSYTLGFTSGDMGSASAVAWVMVTLVMMLVAGFIYLISKSEKSR